MENPRYWNRIFFGLLFVAFIIFSLLYVYGLVEPLSPEAPRFSEFKLSLKDIIELGFTLALVAVALQQANINYNNYKLLEDSNRPILKIKSEFDTLEIKNDGGLSAENVELFIINLDTDINDKKSYKEISKGNKEIYRFPKDWKKGANIFVSLIYYNPSGKRYTDSSDKLKIDRIDIF